MILTKKVLCYVSYAMSVLLVLSGGAEVWAKAPETTMWGKIKAN